MNHFTRAVLTAGAVRHGASLQQRKGWPILHSMKKAHLLLIGVGGMALAATIVVLIVIVQPLLFGGAPGVSGTVTSRGTALVGGPFSLTDHTGKRVTEKDFLGRHMLIFFGYTYCPDVCPGELQVVAAALDALGDKGKQIQPVFITIDPERDTVQQLADYVPHFHKRLIGLTGTADEIAKAAKAYRVYFAKVEDKNASEYLMDHSSILYLMGPKGEFLGHFGYGTQPKELADKLAQYLG